MVFYSPGPVLIDSFELPTIYGEEHAERAGLYVPRRPETSPQFPSWQLSLTAPE
jgi:hypothetical protein